MERQRKAIVQIVIKAPNLVWTSFFKKSTSAKIENDRHFLRGPQFGQGQTLNWYNFRRKGSKFMIDSGAAKKSNRSNCDKSTKFGVDVLFQKKHVSKNWKWSPFSKRAAIWPRSNIKLIQFSTERKQIHDFGVYRDFGVYQVRQTKWCGLRKHLRHCIVGRIQDGRHFPGSNNKLFFLHIFYTIEADSLFWCLS